MSTEDMLTELPLATFELPQWLVQPAVRSCRLFNSIHKWIHGPNLAYEKGAEGLKSRWAPTALFRSVWTTILNGSWSIGGASNPILQAVLKQFAVCSEWGSRRPKSSARTPPRTAADPGYEELGERRGHVDRGHAH